MSSKEPQFRKEDVWAVAAAIGDGINYEVTYGRNAYDECMHCGASRYHDKKDFPAKRFLHDKNCVVLIARDLLTGETK